MEVETPTGRERGCSQVSVCGVCRTDLDVVEGRPAAPRYPVIPGHQVIGSVAEVGRGVTESEGDRVGIAWINSADGVFVGAVAARRIFVRSSDRRAVTWTVDTPSTFLAPAAFAHAIPSALH